MTDYLEIIDSALCTYIENADLTPRLKESMLYSASSGGKRIRPVLTLLSSEAVGGRIEDALPYACALEMIHTYSLIHDDLPAMDNDDMRRGKPASHIAFGEGNAILAGDALLTLAGEILVNSPNRKASAEIMQAARRMLNGQSLDINTSRTELNDALLTEMYMGKTSALFVGAVLAGIFSAEIKEEIIPEWRRFASELGMLFQITDDILDREQDEREGNITYLSLHSSEEAGLFADKLTESLLHFLSSYQNSAGVQLSKLVRDIRRRTA